MQTIQTNGGSEFGVLGGEAEFHSAARFFLPSASDRSAQQKERGIVHWDPSKGLAFIARCAKNAWAGTSTAWKRCLNSYKA